MEIDTQAGPSRRSIVYINEPPLAQTPQPAWNYGSLDKSTDPSICIDAGSHSWKAGFSTMSEPYIDRLNQLARYRDRKNGKNILLFGRDVDADATSRSNVRQMFDGDLIVNADMLECALDCTLSLLGISGNRVEQGIVITERLGNPLFTRAISSELFFELYNVPSVTYGIDSLFAFSRQKHQDGLAVNLGHSGTTVIPVVGGRGVLSRAKRLPFGGAQASELLLRLAQLKYPSFPTKVTSNQATFMFRETCYFSADYDSELTALANPNALSNMTTVVQFPFAVQDVVEKSEEELAAAAERRRENGRRLQDMQARQRAEKLAGKMVELEEYKQLMADKVNMRKAEFQLKLSETTPFDSEAEIDAWIKKTESDIRRKQRKAMGEDPEPEEEPTFPLVDRPDEGLDEEELREKKKQRLMKAGWEARIKLREEKKRAKEAIEEEKRREDAERATDPEGWAARLREEHETLMLRMEERKKRKAQLGNRKSMAAQARMKTIASLAADDSTSKKRKKNGEEDDGFGRDDSDWAVYREVGGEEESDAEEEDQNDLTTIESKLLQFDPSFSEAETMEGKIHAKNALINAFVRGGVEERYDPESVAQNHQLHLNVERIRVPETWFQPSIYGLDSAGLGEVAGWVLNGFEEEERKRLMQCIFLTGGCANLPGLNPKMKNVLTPLLPFRAPLKIVGSLNGGDPRLEAWKGMAEWSLTEEARQARVTKAEYEESGAEWLKEHRWGNPPPF